MVRRSRFAPKWQKSKQYSTRIFITPLFARRSCSGILTTVWFHVFYNQKTLITRVLYFGKNDLRHTHLALRSVVFGLDDKSQGFFRGLAFLKTSNCKHNYLVATCLGRFSIFDEETQWIFRGLDFHKQRNFQIYSNPPKSTQIHTNLFKSIQIFPTSCFLGVQDNRNR